MGKSGGTIRLTAAQAMVKWLSVQMTPAASGSEAVGEQKLDRYIDGMWAIFGHGNVAGMGEALHAYRDVFPTWRGQNEQTMAHAAIAYAKAKKRTRAMAVTSSIGPGSTNVVTAAALAHVNRLPLLVVAGDVFATRRPDPVLQQVEDFDDGTVSANDCFRPVARYYDRISRPEHILYALPRALRMMTDPANCGPAVLAFCQDVQCEAYDYPEEFFEPRVWHIRRPRPDLDELARVADMVRKAKRPVIISGGGTIYSQAEDALADFATRHRIPVAETQAGKSGLPQAHPMSFGASGVDGSAAANTASQNADLVIGVGTRFQDFTTGSRTLFGEGARLVSINIHGYDAAKHGAECLVGDAKVTLEALSEALGDYRAEAPDEAAREDWLRAVDTYCARPEDQAAKPTDGQVIGAVQRATGPDAIAMCAAGTMPGALKLLWKPSQGGYHMEYGYSCMGYEVAGAMGLKLGAPERDVICFVGDGSYMLANSELATAVMRRIPFTVVLTDNRGYGCINRLQTMGCGGEPFNNMYVDCNVEVQPEIDYAMHAAAMGAHAVKVAGTDELEAEVAAARSRNIPTVIVIETVVKDFPGTGLETFAGEHGFFWDVAVPQVSERQKQRDRFEEYLGQITNARLVN
ncbi:3D-(3,5/4)-trihydroxycyclohexane-1,2-dione acylhydrolase (decyclizing) [Tritonibacter mobilis]|uniref:3D-(3,5/4)-trihydroxycyclohexane-1,2-dione acylhydrolase (decyclizing) n=1 Tax=Tritonibacter mobilis TaxID=379347 RepID=UPI0014020F0E|nr:3D-(3,5/4)-trihydroxycyclohexane-1,2-dione acylhydrolase (decyclizing) [Tritonibacter mobilis]NHM20751.1 3D-(3,5/4)-trihydroxycyclohexane-1,2-dione acylhydrolase (decyclizing) [Tritonibacter mobilis]NHM24904.1 3D-(3,5/4)-trihydroxycyclohexane-1,2-dione acylhydrolase (decyclizing) [Tritonibacter mobilis]